jgi:hypothetical protein
VQFLLRADAEPSPRKGKSRARHRIQEQHIPVELGAFVHVSNVQGDVIKSLGAHRVNHELR